MRRRTYIGELIKEIREDLGLSQQKFSLIYRYNPSNVEVGINYPDLNTLKMLSEKIPYPYKVLRDAHSKGEFKDNCAEDRK